MNAKKNEQLKIAAILYDLGLEVDIIKAMTALNDEDLTRFYN